MVDSHDLPLDFLALLALLRGRKDHLSRSAATPRLLIETLAPFSQRQGHPLRLCALDERVDIATLPVELACRTRCPRARRAEEPSRDAAEASPQTRASPRRCAATTCGDGIAISEGAAAK